MLNIIKDNPLAYQQASYGEKAINLVEEKNKNKDCHFPKCSKSSLSFALAIKPSAFSATLNNGRVNASKPATTGSPYGFLSIENDENAITLFIIISQFFVFDYCSFGM